MFDVVLLSFVQAQERKNYIATPTIGAYKCAHVLRQDGHSCLVINHATDYSLVELKEILDISIGTNTCMFGISTTFTSHESYFIDENKKEKNILHHLDNNNEGILDFIKSKNPNIKFVLGGSHVQTELNDKKLKFIDYVVSGYAEISIVNLVRHLKYNEPLEKSHKDALTKKVFIDDLVAPDYDFKNGNMEWLDIDVVNHKRLPVEMGRGCIFKCKFCSYPLTGRKSLEYVRNIDILAKDFQDNYDKYGIFEYCIVDDTFNDSMDKLEMILECVEKLNFQPKFWCYARLDLIATKKGMLDLLYKIGVRTLFFGIESFDRKAGQTVGKGFSADKQKAMLFEIKKRYPDLFLIGSFLIGLPGETRSSISKTINFIFNRNLPLDYVNLFPLGIHSIKLTFSSEIDDNYEKYGYKDTGKPITTHYMNWESENMTFEEASQIVDFVSSKKQINKIDKRIDYRLENVDYKEFIKEYKSKLLELVKNKSGVRSTDRTAFF